MAVSGVLPVLTDPTKVAWLASVAVRRMQTRIPTFDADVTPGVNRKLRDVHLSSNTAAGHRPHRFTSWDQRPHQYTGMIWMLMWSVTVVKIGVCEG